MFSSHLNYERFAFTPIYANKANLRLFSFAEWWSWSSIIYINNILSKQQHCMPGGGFTFISQNEHLVKFFMYMPTWSSWSTRCNTWSNWKSALSIARKASLLLATCCLAWFNIWFNIFYICYKILYTLKNLIFFLLLATCCLYWFNIILYEGC